MDPCCLWCISKVLQYFRLSVGKFENPSEITFETLCSSYATDFCEYSGAKEAITLIKKLLNFFCASNKKVKKWLLQFSGSDFFFFAFYFKIPRENKTYSPVWKFLNEIR